MERCPEVERLAVDLMTLMQTGDADGVINLFAPGPATLLIGNGPGSWYAGHDATAARWRESFATYGSIPLEPGDPQAWAEGSVAWFGDQITAAFPDARIPMRLSCVAVRHDGRWLFVQFHLSGAVSDEELMNEAGPQDQPVRQIGT
jgi:SnoaL-like domain